MLDDQLEWLTNEGNELQLKLLRCLAGKLMLSPANYQHLLMLCNDNFDPISNLCCTIYLVHLEQEIIK